MTTQDLIPPGEGLLPTLERGYEALAQATMSLAEIEAA